MMRPAEPYWCLRVSASAEETDPVVTADKKPLISGRQLEMLRKAVEIEEQDAKAAGMVGYAARLWAQMGLPYRDPGTAATWTRRNGKLTMVLVPGQIEVLPSRDLVTQYPYGVVPRLLLTWMATEAVRNHDRELSIGPNLASFMRELGMSRDGRTIHRLRNQVQRLAHAMISVTDQRDDLVTRSERFSFTSSTALWISPRDGDNEMLWPSTITLSQEFYDSIVATPVPIDLRALGALRASGGGGLPIDLYIWLAHRMSYLRSSTLVTWPLLAEQFGSQYGRARDFRNELLKALPKVQLVYPGVKVTVTDDGLLLSPTVTPVSARRQPKVT